MRALVTTNRAWDMKISAKKTIVRCSERIARGKRVFMTSFCIEEFLITSLCPRSVLQANQYRDEGFTLLVSYMAQCFCSFILSKTKRRKRDRGRKRQCTKMI